MVKAKTHNKKHDNKPIMIDEADCPECVLINELIAWYAMQEHVVKRLAQLQHEFLVFWMLDDIENGTLDLSMEAYDRKSLKNNRSAKQEVRKRNNRNRKPV